MEGMLIGIMDTTILKYCFGQWCMDHDINTDDPDDLRCAITAYSHYVQNVLTEQFEVEQEEQAINEAPERCFTCKYSELIRYCNEHDITVDDLLMIC